MKAFTFSVETVVHNLPMETALTGARITAEIVEAEAEERRQRALAGNSDSQGLSASVSLGAAPPRILVGDVTKSTSDWRAAAEGGMKTGGAVFAVPPPGCFISFILKNSAFGQVL